MISPLFLFLLVIRIFEDIHSSNRLIVTNKEIAQQFKTLTSLMEVHGENPFKVRSYAQAVIQIERAEFPLADKEASSLIEAGFSKGMAEKIRNVVESDVLPELDEFLEKTPAGVVEMLKIKGIGGKKIGTLWKEAGIDNINALQKASQEGRVAEIKGFGKKTQDNILEQIQFLKSNANKLHFAKAEPFALQLESFLKENLKDIPVGVAGQVRRNLEIVEKIELVVGTDDWSKVNQAMQEVPDIEFSEKHSGPMTWRGEIKENSMPVEIILSDHEKFANTLFRHSASGEHLAAIASEEKSLYTIAQREKATSEEEIYGKANLPFIVPELREGMFELEAAKEGKLPKLVDMTDLKGILHNHSTYSDGKHSLEEMAVRCKEMGYEYLGITDHSKSAYYANGLNEEAVLKQHAEIDALNKKLAPFRIFKGIESDILTDGSLDYADDVLSSFDFIVASIHSGLKMDKQKATKRLITAIANPYTTMLGHPTGRLLLRREGYPIDHQAVIDACAEHKVIIEINANPWRLDLDWRWVHYALEKGVLISINPDAHEMDGYQDMRFGLLVGRKAGLTAEMTFNALSQQQVADYFEKKKAGILKNG